jgi:hypothetical protein
MLESNQHPFAPIQIGMIEIRIDLIGVKSSQRRLVSRGRRMLSIELIGLIDASCAQIPFYIRSAVHWVELWLSSCLD